MHPAYPCFFTPKAMERISYSSFLLVLLWLMVTAEAAKDISTDQSMLLSIKSHLNLNPTHHLSKNWSDSTFICHWMGVTCSSRHQRVAVLDISSMNLTGTLPPQIGNLSFLVSLDVSNNYFHGVVPQEFEQLRRLRVIDFRFNSLDGEIPSWFSSLSRLQVLYLRNNSFTGFIPSSLANASKLEILDVTYNILVGEIPQEIGKLENLKFLILQFNQLTGLVPLTLFNLSNLEQFSFTGNSLSGSLPDNICYSLPRIEEFSLSLNQLSGEIPVNLSDCSKLKILSLSYNRFSGIIPREIGNLRRLEILYLGSNNFTGTIPKELGNMTNLKELGMRHNLLTGAIPPEIFNISSLRNVDLAENHISGVLPTDITCSRLNQLQVIDFSMNEIEGHIPTHSFQCPALQVLSLHENKLQGSIPREIGNLTLLYQMQLGYNLLQGVIPQEIGKLKNLMYLSLHENSLSGSIPTSLLNLSTLQVLSMSSNQLSGYLGPDLGHGLQNLQFLDFGGNNFTSKSLDLSFITSFKSLSRLGMNNNPYLNGKLPVSIGNLSKPLVYLSARNCHIIGSIPQEIGNLTKLLELNLNGNHLDGSLPESIGSLQSLQGLNLGGNNIHGAIPTSLCKLQRLNTLVLRQNQLYDAIPECMANMAALRNVYLDSNKLNSTVPESLWDLEDIIELNLSSNSLIGSLSPSIGNLKTAVLIDLSMNQFSGNIPSTIQSLQTLGIFSLASNKIQGSIPDSVGDMGNLEILNLSHNNLSGLIPLSLEKLRLLNYFDVSFNGLSGEIPSGGPFKNFTVQSFLFNKGLCGDPRFGVPQCPVIMTRDQSRKRRSKLRLILIILSGCLVGAVVFLVLACKIARFQNRGRVPFRLPIWACKTPLGVSYYELVNATDGFGESNLLGSGSFGSVYKGTLRNGNDVAVKVFNMQSEGAFKSFEVECQVLRNLRHRNLCKVIGSCSNQDFKALVLEYMPNGSLEKWLYSHNYFLDMVQRIDIMIDIASALDYLHHGYLTPVVHCDLKPSNVLLDESMVAHLSDFGVAKLLSEGESYMKTMTLATLGYIAPEFGLDGLVSTRCDVYSYGIILMEVFTRTKPCDEMFSGNLSMRSWVNDSLPNAIINVIDSNLLRPEDEDEDCRNRKLDCVSSIMKLALNCSMESPYERISIKDAAIGLKKIKVQLLSTH